MVIERPGTDFLDRLYYGGTLPVEAERLLHEAALSYSDTDRAQRYLMEAFVRFPGHVPVYIACYKFYFYKGNLPEALRYAGLCRDYMARKLGFPEDFGAVTPAHADFEDYKSDPRFYLFTLKAIGYISIRLGQFGEGARYVRKVRELDPLDRMGGSILEGLLEKAIRGESDDD